MSGQIQKILAGAMLVGGLAACSSPKDDGQDEKQPTTGVAMQNPDPYGNIALFEASRSKIKFALVFCENYFPYIYNDNAGHGTWTTGHGLTKLYNADGTFRKVKRGMTPPTLDESDVYKGRYLTYDILEGRNADGTKSGLGLKDIIKVPMDENTLIAACVLRYCIGDVAFADSRFVKQLNAGKKGAELAKYLTRYCLYEGVPKRCYFFAALMAGHIQFSDLLDLRAEGCYNLTWPDIFVYKNGQPKKDSTGCREWDYSKIHTNLAKAKKPRASVLWLHAGKGGTKKVECDFVKNIVPDYIWNEVSNGRARTVEIPQNAVAFDDAEKIYTCAQLNDSSYIAYNHGDYETSLRAAKAAYELAQSDKEIGASTYNIGMAHLAKKNYERAVRYLNMSNSVNPTKAAQTALGDVKPKRNARRGWCGAGIIMGLGALGWGIKKHFNGKHR